LHLDASFYETQLKGEILKRIDGTNSGSLAKTSRLIYTCDRQFPESRRDPETQLKFIAEILKRICDPLTDSYMIENAELQMSFYYEDKLPGDVDFYVPEELFVELKKHNIHMRITILP
jgi:hypothetical protein